MRRGKRLLCGALALLMGLSLLAAGTVQQVYATKTDDEKAAAEKAARQAEMEALEKKKRETKERIAELQKQIAEAKSKKEDVMGTKYLLDQRNQLLMDQIGDTQEQIDLYAQQITEYEDMEAEQYALFCQQVRSEEERGTLSYWSVLFDSASFSDLLSAMDFISEIMDSDQKVIDDLRALREQIEQKKATLEASLAEQQTAKETLVTKKNELNTQRCAILRRCMERGQDSQQMPGLYPLTVPTGGGKTVASLAFALHHAKTHGLERVIYVIPYTSIIEQTADQFRKILGAENVLEHHSGVTYETQDEATPETQRLARATENWDMPVVVTTAVQFFESIYSNRSSKCRKLHNLAKSVIIFDEAQMLPIPYLRPCVSAIAQLIGHFHATAVLCTATQPALNPLFAEFLPGRTATELCPAGTCDETIFRRVTFQKEIDRPISWETVAEMLTQLPQVLCIVNTRKRAQQVYERLPEEGRFHLSTLMIPTDREETLNVIRARLRNGQVCRVVSTSLVEAGVDVDFPSVWRELAGLDSILQAAGRCNREGKRSAAESSCMSLTRKEILRVL